MSAQHLSSNLQYSQVMENIFPVVKQRLGFCYFHRQRRISTHSGIDSDSEYFSSIYFYIIEVCTTSPEAFRHTLTTCRTLWFRAGRVVSHLMWKISKYGLAWIHSLRSYEEGRESMELFIHNSLPSKPLIAWAGWGSILTVDNVLVWTRVKFNKVGSLYTRRKTFLLVYHEEYDSHVSCHFQSLIGQKDHWYTQFQRFLLGCHYIAVFASSFQEATSPRNFLGVPFGHWRNFEQFSCEWDRVHRSSCVYIGELDTTGVFLNTRPEVNKLLSHRILTDPPMWWNLLFCMNVCVKAYDTFP